MYFWRINVMVKLIAGISTIFAFYLHIVMNNKNNKKTDKVKLSEFEYELIRILKTNATLSNKEISAMTKKSATTVSVHKRRLYQLGIINSHVIILNKNKIDDDVYGVSLVILSNYSKQVIQKFKKDIEEIGEVDENCSLIIPLGVALKIKTADYNAYYEIERRINSLENVKTISSLLDMDVTFHRPPL